MQILTAQQLHLVGIKGVAMTALAQVLVEAGIMVTGSDVAEDFVTAEQLQRLDLQLQSGFEVTLPPGTQAVIYTAAHHGQANPQVQQARQQGLPTFSHAEALGQIFNEHQGIAVCGVGGKSTTSAMVAWVLQMVHQTNPQTWPPVSFAVGVGNIPVLNKTGQWSADSRYFVAEADEYVVDSTAPSRGEEITPRFRYLQPWLTICTNLQFDHPDVYRDFDHTKTTFLAFFQQIKPQGFLVINADDTELVALSAHLKLKRPDITVMSFGQSDVADINVSSYHAETGVSTAQVRVGEEQVQLRLPLPGAFNMGNAAATIAACHCVQVPLSEVAKALATFPSTTRRAEFKGEKSGVLYYDDYAHHPHEVAQVITAYREWFPTARLVVAFQAHTFSRTKALFSEFVSAFDQADQVVMIDIFASAREEFDSSVSSDTLCEAINLHNPRLAARNLQTLEQLAQFCKDSLQPGDVCLTLGAGDIYHLHEKL